MLKNSVKLTAVSLGLVSVALVSCKGKTDSKTVPTAAADVPNPAPVKNLTISFNGEIPLGGCTTYTVHSIDDKGNKTDITNHLDLPGANVSIALDHNSKDKFELIKETSKICANSKTVDTNKNSVKKVAAVKGDEATVTLIGQNFSRIGSVKVGEKGELNLFVAQKQVINSSTQPAVKTVEEVKDLGTTALDAYKGSFTDTFVVYTSNSAQKNTDNAEFLTDAKLITAKIAGNAVKVVSEIKDKVTYFKVEVPKKLDKNAELVLEIAGKTQTISLTQKVKISSIEFTGVNGEILQSTGGKEIPKLTLNTDILANVVVNFSDDEKINVTTYNDNANGSKKLANQLTKITANKGFALKNPVTVQSDVSNTFDNPMHINILPAHQTTFLPNVVNFTFKNSEVVETLTSEFKYYVNDVPTLENPTFTINSKNVPTNEGILNIDVKANQAKNCATLTGLSYKLGNGAPTPFVNDSFSDFVEVTADDDNLKVIPVDETKTFMVCATLDEDKTAPAKGTLASVTVKSKLDDNVKTKFNFKIGDVLEKNEVILVDVNNNKAVEEINIKAGTKSGPYRFAVRNARNELTTKSVKEAADIKSSFAFSSNLTDKVVVLTTANSGEFYFNVETSSIADKQIINGNVTLGQTLGSGANVKTISNTKKEILIKVSK